MQEITRLLDEIVTRTLDVKKKNVSGDALLDIDLVKDDIRQLYRRMEMLRGIIAAHARTDSPSTLTPPVKETIPPDQPDERRPPEAHQPESTPTQAPANTPNQPEAASTPEEKPQAPVEDQASEAPPQEPKPDRPGPIPSHPAQEQEAQPLEGQERKGAEPNEPDTQAGTAQPGEKTAQHAARQEEEPAASREPVKETHQEQKAQTPPPPPPKSKNNNGNRAVIDILAEYSDRTIGDAYLKEQDDSLHNRISGDKEDKSIGERMQKQPISNLKDAIGVNEKFLFINELFDGNIQDYQEAIARLNDMEDARAAFDYLNTLGVEYAWDATRSADTIQKLAQLVQRRHL